MGFFCTWQRHFIIVREAFDSRRDSFSKSLGSFTLHADSIEEAAARSVNVTVEVPYKIGSTLQS